MSSQGRSECKLDINSSRPPSQAHDINTIAFISISFPPVSYVYFAYAFRILSIFYHIFARILTSCQFRLSTLSNLGSGSPFTHSLSSCISAADLENTTVRAYKYIQIHCCYFCSKRRPATHPPPTRHTRSRPRPAKKQYTVLSYRLRHPCNCRRIRPVALFVPSRSAI